jgi:hypothetical protein
MPDTPLGSWRQQSNVTDMRHRYRSRVNSQASSAQYVTLSFRVARR